MIHIKKMLKLIRENFEIQLEVEQVVNLRFMCPFRNFLIVKKMLKNFLYLLLMHIEFFHVVFCVHSKVV